MTSHLIVPWLSYKELWIGMVVIICLLALAAPIVSLLEWLSFRKLKQEGEENIGDWPL